VIKVKVDRQAHLALTMLLSMPVKNNPKEFLLFTFNPLSAKPLLEKSVFRLCKFYLYNTISDDWL